MIKQEDLYCTIGQANKIKSLGVKQQAIYMTQDSTAVFTSVELGTMLPPTIQPDNELYYLEEWRYTHDGEERHAIAYKGWVDRKRTPYNDKCCFGKTEAQARASLLIYLLENRVLSIDIINDRLLAA